jgi:hypothetical protein
MGFWRQKAQYCANKPDHHLVMHAKSDVISDPSEHHNAVDCTINRAHGLRPFHKP